MAESQDTSSDLGEDKSHDLPAELLYKMESVKLQSDKNDTERKIIIPEWLKDCESPFLWHVKEKRDHKSLRAIDRALQKLDELKVEEDGLTLQGFVLLLKLVLEYFLIGEIEKAWAMMHEAEKSFEEIVKNSSENECRKMKMPLGHAMSATKSHLLLLDGEEEKSFKIGKNIIPLKVMPDSDKGGMWAMKARYYLFSGYEDEGTIAVQCGRKAVECDPDNPEWEYLLAKLLRQKRKESPFSVDIPREELELLERAVEKCKNTKYLVYLAQVYRECGTQAFKHYRNRPGFFQSELHDSIQEMHNKALALYKEALALNENSPSTLRRVGYGLMNLPKKVTDYNLALKCLNKSLELCHSDITLHMLGTFYHRYGNDNKKALEYFEATAKKHCQAGLSDMIRVKYVVDPDYDPCKDLLWGLEWEQKQKERSLFKLQLGGYFLFLRKDFFKSLDYFSQVIDEDRDCEHLKKFKSFFLRMNEPIDIYYYLVNEALLMVQKNRDSQTAADSSVSDEDEINTSGNFGHVEDLLCKISEIRPELMEMTPDPSLVDDLLQTSREIEKKGNFQKRFNRNENQSDFRRAPRPYQRGRGNFRGREQGGGESQWRDKGTSSERNCRGGGRFSSSNRRDNDENIESRGRFSVASQREETSNGEDAESRGRFIPKERGSGGSRGRNYHNTNRGYRRGGFENKNRLERGNNDVRENWREK